MAIKVGVIGCGAIGQRRHLPELAANPEAAIVAVCDVKQSRSEQIAKLYGATAYTDHRQLLMAAGLDAVVIGTPNKYHAPQTLDALAAKKHVLVEKPMAGTREEARAMIAAAEKNARFLMVGQNQRLMPPHAKAKEILDAGKLGRPISFQTTFKHPGPDGWSVDGAKSWFFKKPEAIMGVTGDLGVHKADLMRFLLGEEFVEVNGFIGTLDKKDPATGNAIAVDDNAFLSLKTESGVIGSMTISWTNYGGIEDNGTTIFCENGVLQIGTDPQYGVIVSYKNGQREMHKLGTVATNTKQTNSGVSDLFINAIITNTPPTIDGEEGYKSLDVILTAMESAAMGKTLKIGGK